MPLVHGEGRRIREAAGLVRCLPDKLLHVGERQRLALGFVSDAQAEAEVAEVGGTGIVQPEAYRLDLAEQSDLSLGNAGLVEGKGGVLGAAGARGEGTFNLHQAIIRGTGATR